MGKGNRGIDARRRRDRMILLRLLGKMRFGVKKRKEVGDNTTVQSTT